MTRTRATLALVAAAQVLACRCGDQKIIAQNVCEGVSGVQTDHLNSCATSADCADHYTCRDVADKGAQCCVFASRKCATDGDCCPGQSCVSDFAKCGDNFLECTTDADCGDKGDRTCVTWTDTRGTSGRCRFKACSAVGDCGPGLSCFQGQCMAGLPCNGACPAGSGCTPDADRCQDYSNPAGRPEAACPMTCNTGFIATFADTINIWDTCVLPSVKCVCAELPGLRSEDLGRFSAIATGPTSGFFASGYDGQYGDLVVYRFDATGKQVGLDYVDGVPTGEPKFGPSGPRGGVVEPGPDVGRYTDIASNANSVFVSYYDVTQGDLKVAVRDGSGKWTTHKVDGDVADVGMYSSIAVDAAGVPGISYFQRGGDAAFDPTTCPAPVPTGPKGFITALKFAKAKTASPSSSADWTVKTLRCRSRVQPACFGCGQVCADTGSGPSCYPAATTCASCDPNTETCVTSGGSAKCGKKFDPSQLVDITDGIGLFTSLAFSGTDAYVAYQGRYTYTPFGATKPVTDGTLYGQLITSSTSAAPYVVLDDSGDTGYFAELKLDPTTKAIGVAYHNFSTRKLMFYTAPSMTAGVTPEVIDTGTGVMGSGQWNWVGTDVALMYSGTAGTIYAAYQDATTGDLKLAKRTNKWALLSPVATSGALGFFADGVWKDNQLVLSHVQLKARLVGGEPHVDNKLLLNTLAPP